MGNEDHVWLKSQANILEVFGSFCQVSDTDSIDEYLKEALSKVSMSVWVSLLGCYYRPATNEVNGS